MKCPFCQNHSIAHPSADVPTRAISFDELAVTAQRASLNSVAYTYNEPTLQAEYIFAAAPLLKSENIATVMVTNGMFSEEVCNEAVRHVDAMNVDVKTFDETSYRSLGGSLETVKKNVERLVSGGVHIELTNLIVPGVSDSEGDFARLVEWITGMSRDIPLHISRYFPAFMYSAPPTDMAVIRRFHDLASRSLNYVYTGNV
jgi:pyruvate formate lyase activating enzyme